MIPGNRPTAPLRTSLFAHLALAFGAHPENLATEALLYVLRSSSAAQGALLHLIHELGVVLPESLHFRTQAAGEGDTIPDLVGSAPTGERVLIIEAKFWPGLTDHQPVDYLKLLPPGPGLLLVLAPERRLPTLWPELLHRCAEAGLAPTALPSPSGASSVAALAGDHRIAAVSWRALLAVMLQAATLAGDTRAREDLDQLGALAERMDTDAFLPLRSEELSPAVAQRIVHFAQLVDELKDRLVGAGWCTREGLRQTSGPGRHGHYLSLDGCGVYLHTDAKKWFSLANTPFWLSVHGRGWKDTWRLELDRLAPLAHGTPPRLFQTDEPPAIPLYPPLNTEKEPVLQALMARVGEVRNLLATNPPPPGPLAP